MKRGRQIVDVAAVAAVLALSAGCAGSDRPGGGLTDPEPVSTSSNPFRIGRPLVIPHGGGDGMFPEDTLYAFEHSLALGGDVVDADVRLTADGVPIALHDSTLDRTTNGSGTVASMAYADIRTLDAGWGFDVDGTYPFRGKGITIPTIESLLLTFPQTLFTLDLKDTRAAAVRPLCDLLRSTERTDDVYVGVDTTEQVLLFRELCPEVATSGTDDERRAAREARTAGDATFASDQEVSQPEYIGSDGERRVTASSLAFAHRNDTAVLAWVVDDREEMRTLIELGVDGIYTRRPDVMVELLGEMGFVSAAATLVSVELGPDDLADAMAERAPRVGDRVEDR